MCVWVCSGERSGGLNRRACTAQIRMVINYTAHIHMKLFVALTSDNNKAILNQEKSTEWHMDASYQYINKNCASFAQSGLNGFCDTWMKSPRLSCCKLMTNTHRKRLFLLHSAILHRLLSTAVTVVMMVMMLLLLFLLFLFLLLFLLLLLVFGGLLIIRNQNRRWKTIFFFF